MRAPAGLKVAVVGKGGSGKTALAGILARSLARAGRQVIALDCDANPSLGISLGVGVDTTEQLAGIRQSLNDGGAEHAPGVEELLDRFGWTGRTGYAWSWSPESTSRTRADLDAVCHPSSCSGRSTQARSRAAQLPKVGSSWPTWRPAPAR